MALDDTSPSLMEALKTALVGKDPEDEEQDGPLPADTSSLQQSPGPTATTGVNPNASSVKITTPEGQVDVAGDDEDDSDDEETPVQKAPLSEKQKYQALLDQATGKIPVSSAMNTSDAIKSLLGQNNEDLADAQQQRKQAQLIAMLTNAGSGIAHALSPMGHLQSNDENYKNMMAVAQQPVQDVLTKQASQKETLQNQILTGQAQTELEKTDPTSTVSKTYRDVMKKMGFTVADTANAASIEKAFPAIEKYAAAQDTLAMRKLSSENSQNSKDETNTQKYAQKFEDSINPAKVSSRSPMGKSQLVVDQATRIEQLLGQYPDLSKMPPNQVYELSNSLNTMLTNGQPSIEGTKHLVPSSLVGDVSGIRNYIMNIPGGADQANFIKNISDTISREKQASSGIVQKYQMSAVNSEKSAPWTQKHPDRFQGIVSAYGLDQAPKQNSISGSPQPGSVEDHNGTKYKFKGGNPADQSSWEKL